MVLITVATDKTQYTPNQQIGVSGTLRNDNGTPLGNTYVRVRFLYGATEVYNYGFFVDAAGMFGFQFSGFIDPGAYTCEASYPTSSPTVTATSPFTVTGTVVITLTLDKTTVEPGESLTASGTVTLNGSPYAGASLSIGIGNLYSYDATTDAAGHYSRLLTPSLNVGTYTVTAVSGPSSAPPVTLHVAFLTTITLTLDKTTMGQSDPLTASGYVLKNGSPLSGQRVFVVISQGDVPKYDNNTYTDSNGQYSFVLQPNLPAGQYTVVAFRENGPQTSGIGLTVTATPPPVTTVTLSVSPTSLSRGVAFTATGSVTTSGQPVGGASVTVSVSNGSAPVTVATSAGGAYSASLVSPSTAGSYEVRATSGAASAVPVLITVAGGGGGGGGDGGFDWTQLIPLLLLGIGGIAVLAAMPIIIGITRTYTHEIVAQLVPQPRRK